MPRRTPDRLFAMTRDPPSYASDSPAAQWSLPAWSHGSVWRTSGGGEGGDARHRAQRTFARAVAVRGGRREEGDQGTDVHDGAIAARHKRRQRGLQAEKHAGLVDRNDPVPPFDRLVLDAGVMDDTGSVRERGERTEGGGGGGDGRLPAFAVRNVEPDEVDRKSTRLNSSH